MSFENDLKVLHDELNPKQHPLLGEDPTFRYQYVLARGLVYHTSTCTKSCKHEDMVRTLSGELGLTESQADKMNKRISEIIAVNSVDSSRFECLLAMDQNLKEDFNKKIKVQQELSALENPDQIIADIEKELKSASQQIEAVMGDEYSRAAFKEKFYFAPKIDETEQIPKDECRDKFTCESDARGAAVDQMYKWHRGLTAPVIEMHAHYSAILNPSKNSACSDVLNSCRSIFDKLFATMSNNNSEITLINMQLNVKPQKLEDMNKENSEIYINGGEWAIGFYDNLYVNGYIKKKGFIMDDWRYSFESTKIRNAQLKESREKFGKITDHFFEDCFRKFKAFTADLSKQLTVKLDEIKQAAANGNVERKKALENNIVDIDSIIDEHIKSVKNLLGELS